MKPSLPIGSVRQMVNGYLKVKTGPGYKDWVYQHRHVMEKHLGRTLSSRENVHHLDDDKTNNDLSNLELIDRAAHVTRHRTGTIRDMQLRASILALNELGFSQARIGRIVGRDHSTITRHIQRSRGISRSRVPQEG